MQKNSYIKPLDPSFRDPAGSVFEKDGEIYRCINYIYKKEYDTFLSSKLSEKLIDEKILIPFINVEDFHQYDYYRIIKPLKIEQISYPYEWSFSQLKDAALTTLKIAKIAIDYGMELKDASAYNIQFFEGSPILIDILSFRTYKDNTPWIAYKQFCQHFLAPLLLMTYKNIHLNNLLKLFIDGIPLSLTNDILGIKKYYPKSLFHIYFQDKLSNKKSVLKYNSSSINFSKKNYLKIIDDLIEIINNLKIKKGKEIWSSYYEKNILNTKYLQSKQEIVSEYLSKINPYFIYDIGANNGLFSKIASLKSKQVISIDSDPECVESNYLDVKENNIQNILPLVIDLTNPSPSIGWENLERDSFLKRMKKDTILALAIIHHLLINNNLPMTKLAQFFNKYCINLIIEFIPIDDPKVKVLLSNRDNIFQNIKIETFEDCFSNYFHILEKKRIDGSERVLYLMKSRND